MPESFNIDRFFFTAEIRVSSTNPVPNLKHGMQAVILSSPKFQVQFFLLLYLIVIKILAQAYSQVHLLNNHLPTIEAKLLYHYPEVNLRNPKNLFVLRDLQLQCLIFFRICINKFIRIIQIFAAAFIIPVSINIS